MMLYHAHCTATVGDVLTVVDVEQPTHGKVVTDAAGNMQYVPNQDYFGNDVIRFKVSDGTVTVDGVLELTVTAVNDAPVVSHASYTTAEDTAIVIDPRSHSSDVDNAISDLRYSVTQQPKHGTLTTQADGTWLYTPALNYYGTDSFAFIANDGALNSTAATVSLNITPINDAPTYTSTPVGNYAGQSLYNDAVFRVPPPEKGWWGWSHHTHINS